MNIFVLDQDIEKSSQFQVDRHCIKMLLEHQQILFTVHHVNGTDYSEGVAYKKAYAHHPCVKWACESKENYLWLVNYNLECAKEYTYRYGKIHKCQKFSEWCKEHIPHFEKIERTPFALAMPDECKSDDPVQSYRDYYNKHKRHLFVWKNRETPYWIKI